LTLRSDDLLRELREAIHDERTQAADAINTLARTQVARGLAPLFLTRGGRPFEQDAQLAALLEARLLDRAAAVQKPPELLRFYRALLVAADPPRAILELGVKGGASTALWKALFPAATVVGVDIRLRSWLGAASTDGVIYIEGDQTDTALLARIAEEHGPFDLVIDDGSHVSDHQAISLRALMPHVRGDGLYVIEDVHTPTKAAADDRAAAYGEDLWPDFVTTMLNGLRRTPPGALTAAPGGRLALDVLPRTASLTIGARAIVLRAVGPR